VTLAAPGDIVIDGLANVVSDDFLNDTSGGVTATAGGAINIVNNQGAGASLGAGGNGDVVLTAGADNFLNLTAPTATALFANSGDVTVNADRVHIDSASGITAASGVLTFQPRTA